VGNLLGGLGYIVHGDDERVQIVLDGVELAMIGVGDLRWHIALADAIHIIAGDIERCDHRIQNGVHPAHDVGIRALELVLVAALGQLSFLRCFGQAGQFFLE